MRARSKNRPAQDRRRAPRSVLRRLVWLLSWGVSIVIVVASGAWLFAGQGWWIDLVANLTAQISVVTLLLMMIWAAVRRWRLLLCVACAVPLQVLALAPGRAERGAAGDDTAVRLLTFNTYSRDRASLDAVRILEESDTDVFTIIEPTPGVIRLLRDSESFRARYPHVWPARPYAAKPTIVSRWPIDGLALRFGPTEEGQPDPGVSPTGAIIRRPGGAFVLIATHPPSPRSRSAWANGNEAIRRLSRMVLDLAESHNLPIVVGGDFNSTPTGWRSRYLHEQTGLRRGKAWLKPVGTWPNGPIWPARLAIDDVFVSEGVDVASWGLLSAPSGGDHSPVLIGLRLPAIE